MLINMKHLHTPLDIKQKLININHKIISIQKNHTIKYYLVKVLFLCIEFYTHTHTLTHTHTHTSIYKEEEFHQHLVFNVHAII